MKTNLEQLTNQIKDLLDSSLYLNGRTKLWNNHINLKKNIPELDHISIMNVISALETTFGIFVEEDDVHSEIYQSLQSLVNHIHQKYLINKTELVAKKFKENYMLPMLTPKVQIQNKLRERPPYEKKTPLLCVVENKKSNIIPIANITKKHQDFFFIFSL